MSLDDDDNDERMWNGVLLWIDWENAPESGVPD